MKKLLLIASVLILCLVGFTLLIVSPWNNIQGNNPLEVAIPLPDSAYDIQEKVLESDSNKAYGSSKVITCTVNDDKYFLSVHYNYKLLENNWKPVHNSAQFDSYDYKVEYNKIPLFSLTVSYTQMGDGKTSVKIVQKRNL